MRSGVKYAGVGRTMFCGKGTVPTLDSLSRCIGNYIRTVAIILRTCAQSAAPCRCGFYVDYRCFYCMQRALSPVKPPPVNPTARLLSTDTAVYGNALSVTARILISPNPLSLSLSSQNLAVSPLFLSLVLSRCVMNDDCARSVLQSMAGRATDNNSLNRKII